MPPPLVVWERWPQHESRKLISDRPTTAALKVPCFAKLPGAPVAAGGRMLESCRARHFGTGPFRTHRLRFISETWVTLSARRGLRVVRACVSHRGDSAIHN